MSKVNGIFTHIKRDAMAGLITGLMAIPLSAGICIMSNYPVMTGLYTVIAAGIVSFICSLFRPGNYTGMPGVAAGLAPALALGITLFGIENMPFVILVTTFIQILVWRKKWERYILRLVPHYLVEGLLAGVGLKIMLKFLPYLEGENTLEWGIYISSMLAFVALYHYFGKKRPALPYIAITFTSLILGLYIPFDLLVLEAVPFQIQFPLPHFPMANTAELLVLSVKILAFAMMLASIDVIEQVMSNVAIEELDPFKRPTSSNNSLLAIWIANLIGTFFGGMTNLDGLAKSTTNTVAGAVTKLSNVFTSLVLLLAVLFPDVMTQIPLYALAVIMMYSGWKMVAKIGHTYHSGRYAFSLASLCAGMVFWFGIFEGLIIVLALHGIIRFIQLPKGTHTLKQAWGLLANQLHD